MPEIQLTQGRVAVVDADDFALLSQFKWRLHVGRYAARSCKGKVVLMHRVILSLSDEREGDHINGDGLDNRRVNLRQVTRRQNLMNKKPYKRYVNRRSGTPWSQFKGVSWGGSLGHETKPWRARIHVGPGKERQLGRFATELQAARVYDKAAREHYGEFARLNFPESREAAVA